MSPDDTHDDDFGDELATLYVHISEDGSVFLMPDDIETGLWADLSRLRAELTRLQEVDGQLLYSTDVIEGEPSEEFLSVIEMIDEFDIEIQLVDPHPAANCFYKSYVPHIYRAIEVAALDVEGTQAMLTEAEAALAEAEVGSSDHSELLAGRDRLIRQLKEAKTAQQKLLDLQLEICTEMEGVLQ